MTHVTSTMILCVVIQLDNTHTLVLVLGGTFDTSTPIVAQSPVISPDGPMDFLIRGSRMNFLPCIFSLMPVDDIMGLLWR